MSTDVVDNSATSVIPEHLIPVHHNGSKIKWDHNDASIDGALTQFGFWSQRTDTFESLFTVSLQSLFANHAVRT